MVATSDPEKGAPVMVPALPTQVIVVQQQQKSRRRTAWLGCLLFLTFMCYLAGPFPVEPPMRVLAAQCAAGLPSLDLTNFYADNRERVLESFRDLSSYEPGEALFYAGNEQEYRTNSDTGILFRQDSNFLFMTGHNFPDCALLVDIDTSYATLFVPTKTRSELIFDGGHDDFDAIIAKTQVDEVRYVNELADVLEELDTSAVHVIDQDVVDAFPALEDYSPSATRLLSITFAERQVKSEAELDILRYSALVSSKAHESIMSSSVPGWNEADIESLFLYENNNCGLRFQSYIPIVGAGANGAILHYIRNDAPTTDGDMILVDAAGEYLGYTSDVTRTWPINGTFSPAQALVYNIVLDAQQAAIDLLRPGVSFSSVSSAATRQLVTGMLEAGFFIGGTVDQLLSAGVIGTFYPHGLGHAVGLDVHDPQPGSWSLTTGNVLTIEPGIYFIEMLIDEARESSSARYYNFELIDQYLDFGGVRIEDVFAITSTGYEMLSSAPKTIDGIEALMAGFHADL